MMILRELSDLGIVEGGTRLSLFTDWFSCCAF